ncbi:MAG: hypothetical protein QOF11_338 [Chloroflexota bacterium]|nr:hypothetical protein [Chloroflexota bacterium]
MRRIFAICIAIVFAAALPGSAVAARPQPRVAIVVGPAEGVTNLYRSIGAAVAREARRWTSDVVVVASPNATWPAVKRALRGASIVLYLGHGNGFPSPYRDALYPPTQNGLGLNPVNGAGDNSHQYFGEAFIGREVHLAPGAVVLLNHLCYASGNSEPGLPEGSLEVGRERVDNYAAGWLKAGAGAVIADTFGAPGAYLRAILGGDRPIDRIWREAPTFHDHVLTFPSLRTPGTSVAMDPTQTASGFHRSIVWRPGLRSSDVRAGAGQVATLPIGPLGWTGSGSVSLSALGATFRAASLTPAGPVPSGLVAATRANLSLPVKLPAGVRLPTPVELGVRWDLVIPDVAPAVTDLPGSVLPEPPAIELVVPETPGDVVTPVRAAFAAGRLKVSIDLPAEPGTYRLSTTVHGPDGVAFDADTQALVPALTVRVSRPLSVAYGVVADLKIRAGASLAVSVRLANDGLVPWALTPVVDEDLVLPTLAWTHPPAQLVARWLSLGLGTTTGATNATVPVRVDPGSETVAELPLTAPEAPGDYLIVLDIVSPLHGSLAASGVSVGQIRVTVEAATTPAAP